MHDTPRLDAMSVASLLLAFYKEPVSYRPRLIHGDEPVRGGHIILKIAQGKFPTGLLRRTSAHEQQELKHAACFFVRQVCFWEEANYYQTLCLAPNAEHNAIKENYRLLMGLIHPDRQDSAGEPWPTETVQRANRAYEVLSQPTRRREYDKHLRAPLPAWSPELAETSKGSAGRARSAVRGDPTPGGRIKAILGRPWLIATGVVMALLIVQIWLVNDLPNENRTLQQVLSSHGPSHWLKNALPAGDKPRFVAAEPSPEPFTPDLTSAASSASSNEPAGTSLLSGLRRIVEKPFVAPPDPDRVRPIPQIKPMVPSEAPRGNVATLIPPAIVTEAAPIVVAVAQPVSISIPVANPPPLAPVVSVVTLQNTPPPSLKEGRVTSEDMEMVVVRLVSYYEAGEVESFMRLFDDPSGARGNEIRQQYNDFFHATRERRLRMNNLEWRTEPRGAFAKGQATLTAGYSTQPRSLDRKVSVEMDVIMREGQAKIARLVLLPQGQ